MKKIKVLIAEDEKITALDLKMKLEDEGMEVISITTSGEDAIREAAETRPDVVLMDIVLSGEIDGIAAAQKIGSLDMPVVFLTAYSDIETLQRARETAAYGYLIKPYKTRELLITLYMAIQRHKANLEKRDEIKKDVILNKDIKKDPIREYEYENPLIMVVDDDINMAMQLTRDLENLEYQVLDVVTSGEIAVEKAKTLHPDLILMDIRLQGPMDGIDVAEEISYLEIPIIYLSAYADAPLLERARNTSPYGYLIKPYQEEELNSTILMALEKRKSEENKDQKLGEKISTKQKELQMEKTGIFFVAALIISLSAYGIITRSMTWLMYLLFIPAIYNLIIVAISFRKPESPPLLEKKPFVSILIPAHNEEFTITRCVNTLSQLDYNQDRKRCYEIIVINDGSTDQTANILNKLKKEVDCLEIITRKPPRAGKGKGYVLNDGVRLAKGDLIAVFDADARVEPDFLEKIVPYVQGDDVVGVQARVRMYNRSQNLLTAMQEVEFAIFGNVILRARDVMGKNGFLGGNGQITKRKVLENIEGWDGYAVTEDLNMSIKLIIEGYKIRYCGEAEVWQEAVPHWRAFFRQRVRWATGNLETLFVYLNQIIDAKIPIYKKIDSIQYLFFLLLTAFVMLGYIVAILGLGQFVIFNFSAPLIVGLISTIAFFPGVMIGVYRDKHSIIKSFLNAIGYWAYCFYLIPLFFAAMIHMLTRTERRWAKTHHSG